jgi:hypothetical protein
MSLLDDVSIVVTPNGYKAGTLYGVIPSSGAADMDVTRATAATRVDENGLVNYAEVVSGSDIVTNGDFSNGSTGWDDTNGSITVTNGEATILGNSANGGVFQSLAQTGVTYFVEIEVLSINSGAWYAGGYITNIYSIDNIGKISFYYTSNGTGFHILSSGGAGSITIDNVSVKEVTRDNVPRIDYTGGGCPHILAEPQRTNLIPYSEDFSQSYWTKNNGSISPNSSISPEGIVNADLFTPTANLGIHYITRLVSSSNSNTLSFYVKSNGYNYVVINFGSSNGSAGFDLSNGTITSDRSDVINQSITPIDNGWYRISVSVGTSINNVNISVQDTPFISQSWVTSWTANGTDGIYIWGAQLEQGSYPTSYIPTSGSTVTRNQDLFTRDGIGSLINSEEGVLFLDMAALSDDGTNRVISLYSDSNNRVSIFYSITSNTIFGQYVISGSSTASLSFALSDTTLFSKIAFKYKENDFALWVDGVEVDTDSSGLVLSANTLNNLDFNLGNSTLPFYGKVKQLQVYDTALTDMQLIQLTGTAGTDFYESYSEMAESLTYTIQ